MPIKECKTPLAISEIVTEFGDTAVLIHYQNTIVVVAMLMMLIQIAISQHQVQ